MTMASLLRSAPRIVGLARFAPRTLPLVQHRSQHDAASGPKGNAPVPGRSPPDAPKEEAAALKHNRQSSSYLGTTKRLPEFNLNDKVVLVTGAARGLGLVQAEALLEAGATVYALDRLPEPSSDFFRVQKRAAEELGRWYWAGVRSELTGGRYNITLPANRRSRRATAERDRPQYFRDTREARWAHRRGWDTAGNAGA